MVVVVEWIWVTDNERIEKVVYDVRAAVLKSDADGVLAHLAPNVMYQQGETALTSDATRALIRTNVSNVHLEFARISELRTSVGQQTRRGIAEFRVFTRGGLKTSSNVSEGMTTMTAWSLGFPGNGTGCVENLSNQPGLDTEGFLALPGGLMPSDGSHIGLNDAIGVPRSEAHSFPRGRGGRPKRIPGVTLRQTDAASASQVRLTSSRYAQCIHSMRVTARASSRLLRRNVLLAVRVLENDQFVLLLVVAVLLVRRKLGQRDVVCLDDLGHEFVIVFGISVVRGVVNVQCMLDLRVAKPVR